MLAKNVEKALNNQIEAEMASSQYYLAMASWAETQGFEGVSNFLYRQSDEEREHMLKLVKYVNERGGSALVPALAEQPNSFESINDVFSRLLEHEIGISAKINELIAICLNERDYTTQNFLQWYVAEQIEEEALARTIMDKLKLIGADKGGLYLFDRDISSIVVTSAAAATPMA
ncbi:ferritin [Flavobacteriales bacterium]|jgi:ferritin|nr:ferritin [Flavobacteriales bacterium]